MRRLFAILLILATVAGVSTATTAETVAVPYCGSWASTPWAAEANGAYPIHVNHTNEGTYITMQTQCMDFPCDHCEPVIVIKQHVYFIPAE